MKQYIRIMPGANSMHAKECLKEGFIGADYGIDQDLGQSLAQDKRTFNKEFIPVYLSKFPDKGKVAAGLACGMLHTVAAGLLKGDIILCPDGSGRYHVGEIDSEYYYVPGEILPHRRIVRWYEAIIDRADMSEALQHSTGSIGTVSDITKYAEELETLLEGKKPRAITSNDETIEDPSVFALEQHLEDFLVKNWQNTELGRDYDLFEEDGEIVGQQYPSDTGPIDILAISKDRKSYLVVELKKGRVSDNVVGQIQRYMGYVQDVLAEGDQKVKGIIIGLEDDLRIRRALQVTNNIDFYRYQVSFKLFKG